MKIVKWYKAQSKSKKIVFVIASVIVFLAVGFFSVVGTLVIREDIQKKTMSAKIHDFIDAHEKRDIHRIAGHYYEPDSQDYKNIVHNPDDYFSIIEIDPVMGSHSFTITYVHTKKGGIEVGGEVELYVNDTVETRGFSYFAYKSKGKWYFSLHSIINQYSHWPENNNHTFPAVILDKTILSYTVQPNEIIDHGTFIGCQKLLIVNFPGFYEEFDPNWFYDNKNLIAINFDESNDKYSSVDGVVFNKSQTELIFYPKGKIQSAGFADGTYTIPSSVSTIKESAFQNCAGIRTITIPSSVKTIEAYAFQSVHNLTQINFSEGIEYIGDGAFKDSIKLENLVLPSSIKTIGREAFYGCFGILELNFKQNSNLTSLGFGAFERCANMRSISLPDSLKAIDNWTFQDCHALEEMRLPINLNSIGMYAFRNCLNLTQLYLPKSVTHVEKGAFSDCRNLTLLTAHSSQPASWHNEWSHGYRNSIIWDSQQ